MMVIFEKNKVKLPLNLPEEIPRVEAPVASPGKLQHQPQAQAKKGLMKQTTTLRALGWGLRLAA